MVAALQITPVCWRFASHPVRSAWHPHRNVVPVGRPNGCPEHNTLAEDTIRLVNEYLAVVLVRQHRGIAHVPDHPPLDRLEHRLLVSVEEILHYLPHARVPITEGAEHVPFTVVHELDCDWRSTVSSILVTNKSCHQRALVQHFRVLIVLKVWLPDVFNAPVVAHFCNGATPGNSSVILQMHGARTYLQTDRKAQRLLCVCS
jgi:hypothetical protein